jgi:diguanylate cyclase (GGDEF)-like protein
MSKQPPLPPARSWSPAKPRQYQQHWNNPEFATSGGAAGKAGHEGLQGNWNLLIGKFKARHGLVGNALQPDYLRSGRAVTEPTRRDMQEGVAILERMYAELKHTLEQRRRLEHDLFEARAALVLAQKQLANMHTSERRARHQARHDGLTMLPNRSFFLERMDQALAHAASEHLVLAVLYIDLDGFKAINDEHGHETGDELLRVVGARLARAVRSTDMVSRLGGDEFGCLLSELPNAGHKHLDRIVAKLEEAIAAPFRIGTRSLSVLPSIGIALYPADGTTTSTLLSHADAAMYRAKAVHTGHEFFDPLIHDGC